MIVFVSGNIDAAIRKLKQALDKDGIFRQLRMREIPRRGERVRFKKHVAEVHRARNKTRNQKRRDGAN